MVQNTKFKEIALKTFLRYPGKPTIVFLHDSLGCIELWRDFPRKLGELTECNVIIYDRQGYGNSLEFSKPTRENNYMELEADYLIQLLDYWQIQKPILFGHSDGGSIALIAAGKYPEKIKAIITEGAHVFVEEITLKGIHEAVEIYKNTDLKTKLEKYHGSKTDDLFWAWASTWTTEKFRSWNIEKFLPIMVCPSLIIQGENDEYGSLAQVKSIVDGSGGKSVALILPEIKHSPHKENPEIILEKVSNFILNLS